ncbi:MAG: hypothetical protein DMG77_08265 [Acidobacteria bacterium]|nr:MAG: hypothetical protein DMG77_08265 [Acidobacteriota bacterium]
MKAAAEREPVVVGFGGAKAELAGVGHAVAVEAAVVGEQIESGAQVGTVRQRGGGFDAGAEQGDFDGDAEAGKWLGFGLGEAEGRKR